MVSNRGDASFGSGNDSLAIFSCASADGNIPVDVSFVGLKPAYGSYPREFDFNERNALLAIALQNSQEVVIVQRNKHDLLLGKLLAKTGLTGEIPAVVWMN